MKRECAEVIKQMLEIVPKENQPLIDDLMWYYNDASYKAPEDIIQWERTSDTLKKHMVNPKEDWEFQVLSIFSTVSFEEIKEYYKPIIQ